MFHLLWVFIIIFVWFIQSTAGNFDIASVFVLMYVWRGGAMVRLVNCLLLGVAASLISGYWIGSWSIFYLAMAGVVIVLRQRYVLNHWLFVVVITSVFSIASSIFINTSIVAQLLIWNLMMLSYFFLSRSWLDRNDLRLHYEQ